MYMEGGMDEWRRLGKVVAAGGGGEERGGGSARGGGAGGVGWGGGEAFLNSACATTKNKHV